MKWLDGQITALRERLATTRALNRAMVTHDIAAMRSEVDDAHAILELYAALSERTKDITIHDLCRLLGDGWSYPQLRKRVQLLEAWDLYIERRRAAGDGRYGLAYALELISDDEPRSVVIDDATDSHQRDSHSPQRREPLRSPPDRPRGLLTPPTIRQILDTRYPDGVHDMCPHPRPEGFDALSMKRWPGPVDFINMPYLAYDEINGRSPLAWVTKMIEQHDLYGNELVALMPIYDAINRLLLAGATIEPLGRQKFIDPQSGQLAPHPPSVALLTLRGTH